MPYKNYADKLAYQRKYNASPRGKEVLHKYRASKVGKLRHAEQAREYRKNKLEKLKCRVRDRVRNYLEHTIKQPISAFLCECCGETAQCFHHNTYNFDRFFDGVFLCNNCHGKKHRRAL